MRLVIEGWNLPGRDCGSQRDVHVGLQLRRDTAELVPADQVDEWGMPRCARLAPPALTWQ